MPTVFSNPSNARWGRRLAFLAAIAGVWLLARGELLGGGHDYKGAAIVTAVLVGIAIALEVLDRRRAARRY